MYVIYKNVNIYISKMRNLFLNQLYFGFFQTFEDSMFQIFEVLEETETTRLEINVPFLIFIHIFVYI